MTYQVSQAPHPDAPDLTAVTLASEDGKLTIMFVPGAGMVGSSMRSDGEEMLGQRGGLAAYRTTGKTFGIPLLAPWANRLVTRNFEDVELVTEGTPGVHNDANGLPIHGLLAGREFTITRCEAVDSGADEGAWLVAELDFSSDRSEFPAFPFPHRIEVSVRVVHARVEIQTTIEATGDVRVPIAFGWHPYFAPPGADRQDWTLSRPFVHSVILDDWSVPTGEVERIPVSVDVLGDPQEGGLTYDNLFAEVPPGTRCFLAGGRHRITLTYDSGYPYAVLFAPADQALVAIEPMTAPTDPLSGNFEIRAVEPGAKFCAQFTIHVTPTGVGA